MSDDFPAGFFARQDPGSDADFYRVPRLVTHIDEDAIEAVGALYADLGIEGRVLDLMGSWVSHFRQAPDELTVLGMNAAELAANPQATRRIVHDLNANPQLPFTDDAFDAVVCCVSVDYLVQPIKVFAEVARVVRPGGVFVCTFSNRLFPTKAIQGWRYSPEKQRPEIVAAYFRAAGGWSEPTAQRRTPPKHRGDPLDAVWASRTSRTSRTTRTTRTTRSSRASRAAGADGASSTVEG